MRPCAEPRCPTLVERGRCHFHQREADRAKDQRRGSARARGYSAAWDDYSIEYRRHHPLCHYCKIQGRTTPAQCVDHATPPSGPGDPLFWQPENHRAACIQCNSAKGNDDEPTYLARIGVTPKGHA